MYYDHYIYTYIHKDLSSSHMSLYIYFKGYKLHGVALYSLHTTTYTFSIIVSLS